MFGDDRAAAEPYLHIMLSKFNKVERRRFRRQTTTLIYKNFLIFYKAPVATILRALLLPIAFTLILCFLKNISNTATSYKAESNGIASHASPIQNLSDAINSSAQQRIVFVRNGVANETLNPVINGILQQGGMESLDAHVVNDPDDLFTLCQQSLEGTSLCFASVIFKAINETTVDYIIAFDERVFDYYEHNNAETHRTFLSDRLLPIQWAIDSHVGNFSTSPRPMERGWSGNLGPEVATASESTPDEARYWLSIVETFTAPMFILILVGVVHHLSTFVAGERETAISELMRAQMVTVAARVLSTIISFFAIYLPGFIICAFLLKYILFTRTSIGILLALTVLAGMSMTISTHLVASFFGKAQLAGLYCSVLAVALAFVTVANTLSYRAPPSQILGLALVFPPMTWATLIGDIARAQSHKVPFSLSALSPEYIFQSNDPYLECLFDGYLYFVFFCLQIVIYGIAAYIVEWRTWDVTRKHETIDMSSDVAIRCTGLSKTYTSKSSWYWPAKNARTSTIAVNNLNLEVKTGSVTFLLGPNGGGKTTTMKCIAGMTSMDKGSSIAINSSGLNFGICPQSNVLWENLTVDEHLKIWKRLKTAAHEEHTGEDEDVLVECNLVEKRHSFAKSLSGGQLRRLQLAIAFIGGSKICCIDEASSGLDPLSRRNIWNIIQNSHSRRTILITTHFLDEADILADYIIILHKGKTVCEGRGTSLKARFGDSYVISAVSDKAGDDAVWRTDNSSDATRKLLELEALTEDIAYSITFPTLEQVFLNVTSDSYAEHLSPTDDAQKEEHDAQEDELDTIMGAKAFALESNCPDNMDLDVGRSIGLLRQIGVLFKKRYIIAVHKPNWITNAINLIIPLVIAGALVKFMYRMEPLTTCKMNVAILRNASNVEAAMNIYGAESTIYDPLNAYTKPRLSTFYSPGAIVGPQNEFSGEIQDQIFVSSVGSLFRQPDGYGIVSNTTYETEQVLNTREIDSTEADVISAIQLSGGYTGFGLFAPTPSNATLYHFSSAPEIGAQAFTLVTNRLSNSLQSTDVGRITKVQVRTMRHVKTDVDSRILAISVLLTLAFITATSISTIYPTSEKLNHVRALHYCNGVSPFALWVAYLLFDSQFIILQSVVVWGLLFAGSLTQLWYEPVYIVGVFILFGIASYLGAYIISIVVKRAAFSVAAGLHVFLALLYLAAYVMNQFFGDVETRVQTFTDIQYAMGLTSPGANLLRALILASNSFGATCGKYGDAENPNAFAFELYGGVYAYLIIQIIFLIVVLLLCEYGNYDWVRRKLLRPVIPARLHYEVESAEDPESIHLADRDGVSTANGDEILRVSSVSKFFGSSFAAKNVSFNIGANETLGLLGANGAGKTTVINMIRGELKPDFGDVFINGVSVSRHPLETRVFLGVCPQEDAIDNLTMRQTLSFYASVKGLKNIKGNVDRVLDRLNIASYQDVRARDLSGGTRRKLSVAIAVLGNPRVLLLDEPSTGQDAGAKRILWRAIEAIRGDRAILLTTHSMEEAEALARKVVILGTKMLATGTLSSLQERYGGVYNMKAVRQPHVDATTAERLVKEKFDGRVSKYTDSHGQISFNVPHSRRELGTFMTIMEGLKGNDISQLPKVSKGGNEIGKEGGSSGSGQDIVFEEYSITEPALEDVFMSVNHNVGSSAV